MDEESELDRLEDEIEDMIGYGGCPHDEFGKSFQMAMHAIYKESSEGIKKLTPEEIEERNAVAEQCLREVLEGSGNKKIYMVVGIHWDQEGDPVLMKTGAYFSAKNARSHILRALMDSASVNGLIDAERNFVLDSFDEPETKKVYSEKAVWDGIKNEAYKTRRLDADVAVMEAEQKRYTSPKTNEPANC